MSPRAISVRSWLPPFSLAFILLNAGCTRMYQRTTNGSTSIYSASPECLAMIIGVGIFLIGFIILMLRVKDLPLQLKYVVVIKGSALTFLVLGFTLPWSATNEVVVTPNHFSYTLPGLNVYFPDRATVHYAELEAVVVVDRIDEKGREIFYIELCFQDGRSVNLREKPLMSGAWLEILPYLDQYGVAVHGLESLLASPALKSYAADTQDAETLQKWGL